MKQVGILCCPFAVNCSH